MAMFDDPKKELQRLQEQLLQEEEWFERELDSAKAMIGDAPAKKPKKTASRSSTKSAAASGSAPASRKNTQVRNYANGYGESPTQKIRNTEAYDRDEHKPKKKGIRGLVILAALETVGIVGIVAYWLLFLLG